MSDTVLQTIQSWLDQVERRPIFVGYSGGLDSQVLLHALCQSLPPQQVVALHVNHRISAHADDWQRHCEQQCLALGCRFVAGRVNVESTGQGIEAAARDERYRLFNEQVAAGHSLWLAHHLDDQLETFMLRLLRGAGLHGLSAMQADTERDVYQLLRPFLDLPRADLESFARAHRLDWIEDDSNTDTRYDRNYLRHEIFPRLEQRWPAYRQTLNRSLNQLNQAAQHQHSQLEQALNHRLAHDGAFKAVQLDDWPDDQVISLIHLWLRQQGVRPPSEALMHRILHDVVRAQPDAQPQVRIGDGTIRRFRTALYWVPDQPDVEQPPNVEIDRTSHWIGVGDLGFFRATDGPNRLKTEIPNLNWRMREGGESLWPVGRSKRRDLKRLLQEYRLPPWKRDRLPLLFSGDQLVAVADLCVDREWSAEEGMPGLRVEFRSAYSR